ncbi:Druantia anti-phage system protein DruA [Magnetospirillum aberrantis]|uniref:Druantia anti-phage system protein DruA n=1 Tax=Magnetospirillum aberrantis TaxID=1105283 RepID=UPI00197B11E3
MADAFKPEAKLKRSIRRHFTKLGFAKSQDGTLILPGTGKDVVRRLHAGQRNEKLEAGKNFLARALPKHLQYFADGAEIDPSRIRLSLRRVKSDTVEADLFRLATLTWSVPVSAGFGRRMRYLVWDEAHDRVAGVIALGDPVFNLSVRDNHIGWTVGDRSSRLVNLLDAYVLGAVPPYSHLLGGKAVACLVRSKDIFDDFRSTYGDTVGIISKKAKSANLLVVTTTSSMGKSSVYNRLKLDGTQYFTPVGYTVGWGHFHITDALFDEMREYLRMISHRYADHHQFGQGPNWRLRTIRAALGELGINEMVLRHGIQREVFISTLATNAAEILKTGTGTPDVSGLRTASEISDMARERWMVPRASRREDYRAWRKTGIADLIQGSTVIAQESNAASDAQGWTGRDAG